MENTEQSFTAKVEIISLGIPYPRFHPATEFIVNQYNCGHYKTVLKPRPANGLFMKINVLNN